jgi:uncharacterized protein YoxC
VLSAEAPGLMKKANTIAANVNVVTTELKTQVPAIGRTLKNADTTLAKLPGTLDGFSSLQTKVEATLTKTNPLLDKANDFDSSKLQELTENILLKTGVKIYMLPFGVPETSDWKKKQLESQPQK